MGKSTSVQQTRSLAAFLSPTTLQTAVRVPTPGSARVANTPAAAPSRFLFDDDDNNAGRGGGGAGQKPPPVGDALAAAGSTRQHHQQGGGPSGVHAAGGGDILRAGGAHAGAGDAGGWPSGSAALAPRLVHTDSPELLGGQVPPDGGGDSSSSDEDDDDDDDAPNFDALLCLTTGVSAPRSGGQQAATAARGHAAAYERQVASSPPQDMCVDDDYAPVGLPPQEAALPQAAGHGGVPFFTVDSDGVELSPDDVPVARTAKPVVSKGRPPRRKPRSPLRLDSDPGTQEEPLPAGWTDRRTEPAAQKTQPLKRLRKRVSDENGLHGLAEERPGAPQKKQQSKPKAAPSARRGRSRVVISDDSSDERAGEDDAIIIDGSADEDAARGGGAPGAAAIGEDSCDDDDITMWEFTPGAKVSLQASDEDEDDDEEEGEPESEDEGDPIEVLDESDLEDDYGGAAAAPKALDLPDWRARLPHFMSVGDIEAQRFVVNGERVFVDYRAQFTGASASRCAPGERGAFGGSAGGGTASKKKARSGGAAAKGARWTTAFGRKTFVTEQGQRLTGSKAYRAWQKAKPAS